MKESENKKEITDETLGYVELITDGIHQKYLLFFKNYEDAKKSFEEHKQGFIDANKDKEDLEPKVLIDVEQEWLCKYVNKKPDLFSRDQIEVRIAFLEMKNQSCVNLMGFV